MALTISTGFVVDDAIVVIENISRHLEEGLSPLRRRHARLPRDRLHRALHEHLAHRRLHPHPAHGRHPRPPLPRVRRHPLGRHRRLAHRLPHHHPHAQRQVPPGPLAPASPRPVLSHGRKSPRLDDRRVRARPPRRPPPPAPGPRRLPRHRSSSPSSSTSIVPKGFFPQQDTGRLSGQIRGQQDVSFDALKEKAERHRPPSSAKEPGIGKRHDVPRRRPRRRQPTRPASSCRSPPTKSAPKKRPVR